PELFSKPMPWVHKGLLAIATHRVDWLLKSCSMYELQKIARHFTWKANPDDPNSKEHPIFKIYINEEGLPYRIDMDKGRHTVVIIPRGFSKTTLYGLGVMLYKILYQETKFLVYLSETATAAQQQMGNVKFELSSNPLIQLCFGNLKPDRNDPNLSWRSDLFQTRTGISVAARGRRGQVRGLNIGGNRPDTIIFDDVEDKESVATIEQRLKTKDWMYADVMPALPQMDESAEIIGLGTVLHAEALLMVLKLDPEWTTCIFGAIDKDGEALWEDNLSVKQLENKKKAYALAGLLSSFYMEYMSQLRASDEALFQQKFLILRPEWRGELDAIALACDPAISEKPDADFFGLGVVGITTRGQFLVLEVDLERGVHPTDQIDRFFEASARWQCTKHGVESIAYQRALLLLIRQELFRRNRQFIVEAITHGSTGKDLRIKGILQARYANGQIAHYRRFPTYESQLLDYPRGKKDGPDVVAMAITLLDPFAANFADPESNPLEEDEYPPLGNWRQH
ncbi:hypothetical protein KAR91_18920, partial [Candidatus Pacearchaeota archaeon]|nr:hypothetical protein [Candidatus Pacearchaeota archaeon]